MKHVFSTIVVLGISSVLTSGVTSTRVVRPVIKSYQEEHSFNIDSLTKAVYKTSDSIIKKERINHLVIKSEKKSLELEIDILKRQVDSLNNIVCEIRK